VDGRVPKHRSWPTGQSHKLSAASRNEETAATENQSELQPEEEPMRAGQVDS